MIRAVWLAAAVALAAPAARASDAAAPLPFKIGGPFELTDQHGRTRTQADPDGKPQLLFFGYASCPGICTTALPMMAEAADALARRGLEVQPVMITVDPERDTAAGMAAPLAEIREGFIGLTGSGAALDAAYKAFSVEHEVAFVDPEHGAVYSHGSFVYLLDGTGRVLTLFPPVQDPAHVAEAAAGYLGAPD